MKLKTDRFGKVFAIGTLAIGAVAGLSAAPAGAVTFTGGEFDFGVFTTSFGSGVSTVPGNTVSIGFNPNGTTNIFTASGNFAPLFPNPTIGVTPSTANFAYVSGSNYSLTNDLVFAFGNGVNLTLGQNNIFSASGVGTNSVSLSLVAPITNSFFSSGGDITPVPTFALTLTDSGLPSRGVYVGQVSPTAVPEPFTVIGTLIGGTAAFRLRKKLLASVEK